MENHGSMFFYKFSPFFFSFYLYNITNTNRIHILFLMKQNMFSGITFSNLVKVVGLLALLIFNSKPLEAARPFVVMKSKLGTVKVSISRHRAQVPPSAPDPCTYLPGPGNGSGCHNP